MEFRITITLKRVISVLLILFLGYIGIIKYQTYNKLGLINMNCEYLLSSIEKNNDKVFQENKYYLGTNGYSLYKTVSFDIFKSNDNVYLWNKINAWLMESADYHISSIDKQKVRDTIVSFNNDIKAKKESYLLDNISSIITFIISLAGLITTVLIKKKE